MENIQSSLFGKMYPELFQAIKGVTLKPLSKKSRDQHSNACKWEMGKSWNGPRAGPIFHGEHWTPNIGEVPQRRKKESTLWEIIELNAPHKYFLSQKACQGILRRAETRGKELPKILKDALLRQANQAKETADENCKQDIPCIMIPSNALNLERCQEDRATGSGKSARHCEKRWVTTYPPYSPFKAM